MAIPNSIVPPTYLPYLANTAAVISILPTITGLAALVRPQLGHTVFSFPKPTTPRDQNLVLGLFRIFGVRDLAIGLTTLAIWHYGEGAAGYKTLGVAMLTGGLLVATDGWVSKEVIGKGEWTHWSFLPFNVGIGVALLGWV